MFGHFDNYWRVDLKLKYILIVKNFYKAKIYIFFLSIITNLRIFRLKDAERGLLQILDQPDCYCTVLYNDETHTFEQVIQSFKYEEKNNHYILTS